MNEQDFGSYFTLIYFFLNDSRIHLLFFIILLRKSYVGILFTVLCSQVRTQIYEWLFLTKEDTTSQQNLKQHFQVFRHCMCSKIKLLCLYLTDSSLYNAFTLNLHGLVAEFIHCFGGKIFLLSNVTKENVSQSQKRNEVILLIWTGDERVDSSQIIFTPVILY